MLLTEREIFVCSRECSLFVAPLSRGQTLIRPQEEQPRFGALGMWTSAQCPTGCVISSIYLFAYSLPISPMQTMCISPELVQCLKQVPPKYLWLG